MKTCAVLAILAALVCAVWDGVSRNASTWPVALLAMGVLLNFADWEINR